MSILKNQLCFYTPKMIKPQKEVKENNAIYNGRIKTE
jgi:hypothetical protein